MSDGRPPSGREHWPGRWARCCGDRPAVVMHGSAVTLTYADLDRDARSFAGLLRGLGCAAGDHVALWVENRAEVVSLLWGCLYAGVVVTPISTRLKGAEVAFIVEDSGAAVLVTTPGRVAAAPDLTAELHDRVHTVVIPAESSRSSLRAWLAGTEPLGGDDLRDGALMLYSSGTTGRPKGVTRVASGAPIGRVSPIARLAVSLFGMGERSTYLSPAPIYHAAPVGYVHATTSLGATVVMMERFDAEALLGAIEQHRVTHVQLVPTMMIRLLRLPARVRDRYDLSSLEAVIHAAAPCPPHVKREMIRWLGPIVHEYYAGTEAAGLTHASSEDWLAHPGTVGRAVLGTVRIVDDDGRPLLPGEEGLVAFEGGPRFEYHNDPVQTARAHTPQGWPTMGDIGWVDDEGFLFLTDRRDDTIVSGGVNVSPREVEDTLSEHPDVADVAVVGVPHDELGEEVRAVVEVGAGRAPGPELAATLVAWCRERLADVKCPRSIDFVASLPREPTGKLLRRVVRDLYRSSRAEGA